MYNKGVNLTLISNITYGWHTDETSVYLFMKLNQNWSSNAKLGWNTQYHQEHGALYHSHMTGTTFTVTDYFVYYQYNASFVLFVLLIWGIRYLRNRSIKSVLVSRMSTIRRCFTSLWLQSTTTYFSASRWRQPTKDKMHK